MNASLSRLTVCLTAAFVLAMSGSAQDPGEGANSVCQAAADVVKTYAAADGAFLAAGLLKSDTKQITTLGGLLLYPTDYVVVINLTGSQIKQAFEYSLALYPESNSSFLQISGFEVSFKKDAPPNSRVTSVTASGSKLEDGKTYSVAMPSSLQRGGLGYRKIWEQAKIVRKYENTTLEQVLKGKAVVSTSPRWLPQP